MYGEVGIPPNTIIWCSPETQSKSLLALWVLLSAWATVGSSSSPMLFSQSHWVPSASASDLQSTDRTSPQRRSERICKFDSQHIDESRFDMCCVHQNTWVQKHRTVWGWRFVFKSSMYHLAATAKTYTPNWQQRTQSLRDLSKKFRFRKTFYHLMFSRYCKVVRKEIRLIPLFLSPVHKWISLNKVCSCLQGHETKTARKMSGKMWGLLM